MPQLERSGGRRLCFLKGLSGDQAFIAASISFAVLEILFAFILMVERQWWPQGKDRSIMERIVCEKKTPDVCFVMTVYWSLKTVPWFLGFALERVRDCRDNARTDNWRHKGVCLNDFIVAWPRIGFLLALLMLLVLTWRQFLHQTHEECCQSFCCVSTISFDNGFTYLNLFLIGLCAWAASVLWSILWIFIKFLKFRPDWVRQLSLVLVLWFIVGAIAALAILEKLSSFFDWVHAELGLALWGVATLSFYAPRLWEKVKRKMGRVEHVREYGVETVPTDGTREQEESRAWSFTFYRQGLASRRMSQHPGALVTESSEE